MQTEIERLYNEWLKAEAIWAASRDPAETDGSNAPLTKAVYAIVEKIEEAPITCLKDSLYVMAVQIALSGELYIMEGEEGKNLIASQYRRALAFAGIPLRGTEYGSRAAQEAAHAENVAFLLAQAEEKRKNIA